MEYNVLCLHGCSQTKDMFISLLSGFVKICKNDKIKFFFMQAKYDHPDGNYTWYNKPLEVDKIGNLEYDEQLVSDALDDVETFIKENNINVLLGFSQGGNVVDTFLQHRNHSMIVRAIIMSSYSLNEPDRKIVEDVEVLNVVSEIDEIVRHDLYPRNYTHALLLKHDKGHKIPGNPVMRQVRNFILTGQI